MIKIKLKYDLLHWNEQISKKFGEGTYMFQLTQINRTLYNALP